MNNIFGEMIQEVRKKSPLVHHITNYVTVNDCANITLAMGGSPIMADDEMEVEDIVAMASALVINIGTLNTRTVESMIMAGKKANQMGIPVVLDPVGAGATPFRNQTVTRIVDEVRLSVIKGNISEISFIAGENSNTKGVDASESDSKSPVDTRKELAKRLATNLDCVVAITGKVDVISDGKRVAIVENGHEMMSRITGTGCMLGSLIGCFIGSDDDYYKGTVAAVTVMGIAGIQANKSGTGIFRTSLIDHISNMDNEVFNKYERISE